jgi:hypothetical protein
MQRINNLKTCHTILKSWDFVAYVKSLLKILQMQRNFNAVLVLFIHHVGISIYKNTEGESGVMDQDALIVNINPVNL